MQNLISNWRTTSAGLAMIIGATVHLIFQIKGGRADEAAWTIALLADLTGIGLILAGDASKSATKEEVKTVAADTQAVKTAVQTGDTSMLSATPRENPNLVDNTPPQADAKKP